jgi:flagellar basal body P-ring formation protein FlgA
MPCLFRVLFSPRWLPSALALVLAWLVHAAHAQGSGAVVAKDSATMIAEQSQAWLDQAVAATRPVGSAPLRMVVQVGALDSRLQLAPCAQVEPYLPPGVRLWGNARIGLRCVDGVARWNVFLPVQVQAFGQTWVMRSDVASGSVLSMDDAVLAEVDWAQENASVLADPEMWVGQTATRALRTGQTLRHGMVKRSQVFQAGSMVRIIAQGPGFTVTSDGQALSAGVVGEMARVRTENGRVLSGVVLDMRTVRVNL